MATISIKSNFILENKEFVYNKILEQRRDTLNNYINDILNKHKGDSYREKWFSPKCVINDSNDILEFMKYTQDNYFLSDEKFYLYHYDELISIWTNKIKKFELIVDMAHMSNNVVLNDEIENEKYLINLFRLAQLQ